MFGVPSSLYVPIISTGIGNIQFFTPKFFFILCVLLDGCWGVFMIPQSIDHRYFLLVMCLP